ncbi:hypothetical protein CHS0354_035357 [Potamilus streckersoni]|uniref:DUF4349 domain-containing protein n=1 Tax=Potamilus streckersoni TaxID=2493646 RepID=A0AAE0S2U3_9BIVA|nr:hypothetical protein CHS0354_035357 [Potamilus streckersoni]
MPGIQIQQPARVSCPLVLMRLYVIIIAVCSLFPLAACNQREGFGLPAQDAPPSVEVIGKGQSGKDESYFAASESAGQPATLSNMSSEPSVQSRSANSQVTAPDMSAVPPAVSADKQKIIRTGDLSLKTADVNTSKIFIDTLLFKLGGYYESENLHSDDRFIFYDLRVRVPLIHFDTLLAGLEGSGNEITSKNIRAQDVTEEFVDIETRINTKREYLSRFRELLVRAKTVKDILEIEQQIRVLQEEIENREGRLNYLKDQVNFSTLQPEPEDSFGEEVKKSLAAGWTSLVNLLLWLISVWHLLLLLIAGGTVLLIWIRRRTPGSVSRLRKK